MERENKKGREGVRHESNMSLVQVYLYSAAQETTNTKPLITLCQEGGRERGRERWREKWRER